MRRRLWGERKARLVADLDPDIVATGNPGCLLQLQSSLAQLGRNIPVVHTVQILDAAMRGTPLGQALMKRGKAQ